MTAPRCSYCYREHPLEEVCAERATWLRADDEYDRRVDEELVDSAEGRTRS